MGGKVQWATCNIGATHELELGDSLRWGEIGPWSVWRHRYIKDDEKYERYKYYDSFHYNKDYEYNYQYNNIGGDEEHDAATAYLGKGWRLPTKEGRRCFP